MMRYGHRVRRQVYIGVEGDSDFETTVAQPDAVLWKIRISTPL